MEGEVIGSYRSTVLPCGLRLLVEVRDQAPVVSTMLWLRVGSAFEGPGQTGYSHLLEHMMFKGSDALGPGDIDALAIRAGGSNNAFTSYDYTAYFFDLVQDRWEWALKVEASRLENLLLDPRELEAERAVVLEELGRELDQPWGRLALTVDRALFAEGPYGHPIIGHRRDLEAASSASLRAYYRRFYRPDNACLVVVGAVDPAAVQAAAQAAFVEARSGGQGWADYPAAPGPPVWDRGPTPAPTRDQPGRSVEREVLEDVQTARLLWAWRGAAVGARHELALDLAAHILGGGRDSRLFRALVSEGRLARSVHAAHDARAVSGLFAVSCDCLPELDQAGRQEAGARIAGALEDLARRGPEPGELERAREALVSQHVFGQETASGRAAQIGMMATLGHLELLDRYVDDLLAVTADELQAAVSARLLWPGVRGRSLPRGDRPVSALPPAPALKASPPEDSRGVESRARLRADLPPLDLPVRALAPRSWTFPGGLRLHVLERPQAPVVHIEVHVETDALDGEPWPAGLGAFVGEMLREGTTTRSAEELARAIEGLGAHLTTSDSGISLHGRAEHAPRLIELAADLIRHPAFPPQGVELVRSRTLAALATDADDPLTLARWSLRRLIFEGHPLARRQRGDPESVRAITLEQQRAWHRGLYTPDNALIVVAGAVRAQELREAVERHFGDFAGRRQPRPEHPDPGFRPVQAEHVELEREQTQVLLGHLGVRRRDPDFIPLLALDHLLGSGPGFTDRISRRLRDQEGLAYALGASITSTADRLPGVFLAYIGTSPEKAARAEQGLREEIAAVLAEPPGREELEAVQTYLVGSYAYALETAQRGAELLVQLLRLDLGLDEPVRYLEAVRRLKPSDVLEAARRHLFPERLMRVTVGAG